MFRYPRPRRHGLVDPASLAMRHRSTALLGFTLRSFNPACGSQPCLHGIGPTCRFTERPPRRFESRDQPSNSTISISQHPLQMTVDRGRSVPTSGFCPRTQSVSCRPAYTASHDPALGFSSLGLSGNVTRRRDHAMLDHRLIRQPRDSASLRVLSAFRAQATLGVCERHRLLSPVTLASRRLCLAYCGADA